MAEVNARLLGGHYDSLKQKSLYKAMLCKIPEPESEGIAEKIAVKAFYHKSKIRMMIDLLFSQKLVLTYAQFLDGIYFHHLFLDRYNDEFYRALSLDQNTLTHHSTPAIDIRVWPNEDLNSTLQKYMLKRKEFIFSSLESIEDGLSNKFHLFLSRYFTDPEKINLNNRDFRYEIETNFGTPQQNTIITNWLNNLELMCGLSGGTNGYVSNWEKSFTVCLKEAKSYYDVQYPELQNIINRQKQETKDQKLLELFDTILLQLGRNETMPDRSWVISRINEVNETEIKLKPDIQSQIITLYNSIYNKTFAIQHNCHMCDEGVNKKIASENCDCQLKLSTKTKAGLIKTTWTDFFLLLEDLFTLREALWNSKDRKDYTKNCKVLMDKFIESISPQTKKDLLSSAIMSVTGSAVASVGVEIASNYFCDTNLNPSLITIRQLGSALAIVGITLSPKVIKRMIDVNVATQYAVKNIWGGGSDLEIHEADLLAFTSESLGTFQSEITPIMMMNFNDLEGIFENPNSIYLGRRL
ncbi:MAG: hypothetical protein BWX72_00332 [Firmicutes bacterium ADurb.Bin080]|nr:MAG: hypothetical protein BWX72_00332 [Firmicutes bacterium ADurb.Bin080]